MSSLNVLSIVALSLFGLLIILTVFILPFIRRNVAKKQEDRLDKTIDSFKAGDKILLASGMRGYFVKRKGDVLYVEISKDVIVRIDRHGVIGIYK